MQELEADLRFPKTTVSKILTQDLGMKHMVAKFILWLLLLEQKEHLAAALLCLLQAWRSNRLLLGWLGLHFQIIAIDHHSSLVMTF